MLSLMLSNLIMLVLCFMGESWYILLWGLLVTSFFSFMGLFTGGLSFCMSNLFVLSDSMSSVLVSLTFWISVGMFLSSQSIKVGANNFMLFSLMVLLLNMILMITFCSGKMILFYFFFESSLVPTLCLILGWGYQPERLQASMYMMIYTIAGSLPLLTMILLANKFYFSMSIPLFMLLYMDLVMFSSCGVYNVIVLFIVMAFLIKLPTFMVHVWLPKAHVDAPVAGSMVLAAILLKLGGFGLFRVMEFFHMYVSYSFMLIFSISVWGGLLTSVICFRQTDLKSLIAYSSIGHMALVLGGVLSLSTWGWKSALVLMVSHGFCSSALFGLANYTYELSGTRSLFMNKGLLLLFPFMSMWWFLFAAMNMAAPPSLNLLGELMVFPSILFASVYYVGPLAGMSFLAAAYSMYMYTSSQHGAALKYLISSNKANSIKFLLLAVYWLPCNLLILKSELVYMWV